MLEDLQKRKNIHLKHFDYKGSDYTYFITICTNNKQNYFLNPEIASIVKDELLFRNEARKEINLYCYCLMPDHLHLLLSLNESYNKSLKNWICAFKRYTARIEHLMYFIKPPFWQRDFYEHIIRKHESLIQKATYIVNNPVRKGLVENWEDYPYCGFVDVLPFNG